MPTIIQKIHEQLDTKNLRPGTRDAQNWLLKKVKQLHAKSTDRLQILKQGPQRHKAIVGRFYFFFYNPKLKDVLPYWDKFPLVVPIMQYHDGFLGLNLHYIPPRDRLILLQQLKKFANGSLNDEKTRLKLSYPILKAAHNAYRATPCIKRYLAPHIASRVIEVPADEWHIAAALPLQQFKSRTTVSAQEVWADSKEKY